MDPHSHRRSRAGDAPRRLRLDVSRRYVTEAEAGRANLTVLKLAAMAGALRLSLSELCDLPVPTPRTERIALVGLRGA